MVYFLKAIIVFMAFIQASCADDTSKTDEYQDTILALSWSPTYCFNHADRRDSLQCENPSRRYRMVLHGLWPQIKMPKTQNMKDSRNSLRQYCDPNPVEVSGQIIEQMISIMPSAGLIKHNWRKHGTCSGYAMDEYFTLSNDLYHKYHAQDIYAKIKTTQTRSAGRVKSDIMALNPELKGDNIIIKCSGRMLKEIRLCLTKTGLPRACKPAEQKSSCHMQKIYIPFYPK